MEHRFQIYNVGIGIKYQSIIYHLFAFRQFLQFERTHRIFERTSNRDILYTYK